MKGRDALIGQLKNAGFLRSPAIERAFLTVDEEAFLPDELRFLAYANAPVPFHPRLRGAILPSPSVLAGFLHLLELEPNLLVGIVGAGGGYPAALVAATTGKARLAVAEADEMLRTAAGKNLEAAGLGDRVSVGTDLRGGPFDRILVLDRGQRPLSDATVRLGDMGFAVSRGGGPEEFAFRKRIRSGSEELELDVADMPAGPRAAGSPSAMTWAKVLARDDLLTRSWEGRVEGPHEAHFAEAVDETFEGGPLDPRTRPLAPPAVAARRAFHVAFVLQNLGELEEAADLYERSLALVPTSEGHTFLGWVHSFRGDLEGAIAECHRAIDVDPGFGNPYNDIGAYLIELNRPDEAIPWLKRAIESPRYCCYFYAHTNLGRVYLMQGMRELARKHFEEALRLNPEYEPAREMLRRSDRAAEYFA